jgi:hypothetical protein
MHKIHAAHSPTQPCNPSQASQIGLRQAQGFDSLDVAFDSSCNAINAPDLPVIAGIVRDSVTVTHDQDSGSSRTYA